MRAVVVQHEEHEGEGWFGPALTASGFTVQHRFRAVEPGHVDADLLVVLGGSMSAGAVHEDPFLARELALLVERLQRGAPCLGICLGAQLLARAAGVRVSRGERGAEIGPLPVQWNAAAAADPVLGVAAGAMCVAQWHRDTFPPVPGAVLLASSARYEQQAFRLGTSYAFQFHLELDANAFARWLDAGRAELAAAGHDVAAMQAALPALAAGDGERRALVDRLARHFARVCLSRSERRVD